MAVSKRLRFEILRRDNHTCRYCGAAAPGVKLTIDHVVPEALGGRDEPDNLVTACEACNSGKSSVPAGAPLVEEVRQDALRWARAIEVAAQVVANRVEEVHDYIQFFYNQASTADAASLRTRHNLIAWPPDWEQSIRAFHKYGLPREQLIDAYWRTDANPKVASNGGWRYFCGICWGVIREMREIASDVLYQEDTGA